MIPMQSTHRRELIYSAIADKMERDPVQESGANGRATVPMGRGFALWQRMNPNLPLIYVNDAEGVPRGLTPTQVEVLTLAMEMAGGATGLTMREMAKSLSVAPSTVSRALTKLQAWGLIAYVVGRGRWAGLVISKRVKGDGLDRFRKTAQARVRRWSEAARRRFSRLAVNVAPYILGGEGSLYVIATSSTSTSTHMGATLTAQRSWTAEEVAGIV
jgi:DNA-binding transcriptional regulator YhcF (GntR family)